MCDGTAEGALFGPLGIDVDPLVIVGGVGEEVDPFLCDRLPLGVADLLSDEVMECLEAVDGGGHGGALLVGPGRDPGLREYRGPGTLPIAGGSPRITTLVGVHDQAQFHQHRDIRGGGARAAVFGFSDGLVTNISLVLGVVGASPGGQIVRLVGVAGLVAGAFSMGAGEYLSMAAQRELLQRELDVEREALSQSPEGEATGASRHVRGAWHRPCGGP